MSSVYDTTPQWKEPGILEEMADFKAGTRNEQDIYFVVSEDREMLKKTKTKLHQRQLKNSK